MSEGIAKTGYPSEKEIKDSNGWPSHARFKKGPVAIIECVQQIPCNPCETACPFGAISVGSPITNVPRVDFEKCTGCGRCLAVCPGLAIFLVDKSGDEGCVTFPFEYLPLPEAGDTADALDRAGGYVCKGEIVKVNKAKANNKTVLITVKVPLDKTDSVRMIERIGAAKPAGFLSLTEKIELEDDVIVCRCEEITAGEIRKAIRDYNAGSVTDIKRRVRAGMGLCQGRSCGKLVARILAEETGRAPSEIEPATDRPPVRVVTFGELAEGKADE